LLHLDQQVRSACRPPAFSLGACRHVTARALLKNLNDDYVREPEKKFPTGKAVLGRVMNVEPEGKRVELSLRKADVSPESVRALGWWDAPSRA
jgi:hypothetical protein